MARWGSILKEREKVLLEKARSLTYRKLPDGSELVIHFYFPKDLEEHSEHALFLFLNSGGWDRGNVVQFAPQALHYVDRGAVCGLVQYRNRLSHPESTAVDSLEDGRNAVRFVRHFSEKLRIDSGKVVVIGAGAGANIAGGATMKARLPAAENAYAGSDSRPNAAVLMSAILDVEKGGYGFDQFASAADARRASLSRYISPGLPPILLIHGTGDRLFPFSKVSTFAGKMKRKKNPCELVEFEGRDQNFFNLNTDPLSYEASLSAIDGFLDEHGILAKPEENGDSLLISWREKDH